MFGAIDVAFYEGWYVCEDCDRLRQGSGRWCGCREGGNGVSVGVGLEVVRKREGDIVGIKRGKGGVDPNLLLSLFREEAGFAARLKQVVMGQSEWMVFSFPKNFHSLLSLPYIFIARTIIAASKNAKV